MGNESSQGQYYERRRTSSRRKFSSFSLGGANNEGRRESEGVQGLRIINTADATTLKKELDGYKHQLEEAKALLHRNGLDMESKTANVASKKKRKKQRQTSIG